ncbi:MAG: hypothetical protein K6F63_04295 [Lachnospiraceae bacterium]|nr:hypothetical protein [Lachnospiraceae bacterium]
MLKKKERGEWGYLKYRRTSLTLMFFGVLAAAAAIFVIGLALNKWETTNIFTVVAILGVLPAAKILVLMIVVYPHKAINEEEKIFLDGLLQEEDKIFYDAVFTSSERSMHLDAIFVTGHQIIGYTSDKKDKIDKIEAYFKNEMNLRKLDHTVFITNSDKTLANRFKMRSANEELSGKQQRDRENILEFIKVSIV